MCVPAGQPINLHASAGILHHKSLACLSPCKNAVLTSAVNFDQCSLHAMANKVCLLVLDNVGLLVLQCTL